MNIFGYHKWYLRTQKSTFKFVYVPSFGLLYVFIHELDGDSIKRINHTPLFIRDRGEHMRQRQKNSDRTVGVWFSESICWKISQINVHREIKAKNLY